MIELKNDYMTLSCINEQWSVDVSSIPLAQEWISYCFPGPITDIHGFLITFADRFPCSTVFKYGPYLVDLRSMIVFGDFPREVREKVGQVSQRRFTKNTMELRSLAGHDFAERFLSLLPVGES